jgi:hypothetical protein
MSGGHGHESASHHEHGAAESSHKGGVIESIKNAIVPDLQGMIMHIGDVASKVGADADAGHKVIKDVAGAALGGVADIGEGGGHDHGGGHH